MTVTAVKTKPDPELTAHIQVPDTQNPRAITDRWARTNALLIDLGRFMERTGITFEVTQVDATVLECVCPDHIAFTALRLAYGPFFIAWPRPDSLESDPDWRRNLVKQAMATSAKKAAATSTPPMAPRGSTIWTSADDRLRLMKKARFGTLAEIEERKRQQAQVEQTNRDEVKRILSSLNAPRSAPSDLKAERLRKEQVKHLRLLGRSAGSSETLRSAVKRLLNK